MSRARQVANFDPALFAADEVSGDKVSGGTIGAGTIGGSTVVNTSGAITTTGGMTVDGATVFNEASADVDFRIEGDGDANLFYADAGNDRIGIGESTPVAKLHIQDTYSGGGDGMVHFQSDGSECGVTWETTANTARKIKFSIASNGDFNIYDETNSRKLLTIGTGGDIDMSGGTAYDYPNSFCTMIDNLGQLAASGGVGYSKWLGCNSAYLITYWNTDGNAYGHGVSCIQTGGYSCGISTVRAYASHYSQTDAPTLAPNQSGCNWRIKFTNNDADAKSWLYKLIGLGAD